MPSIRSTSYYLKIILFISISLKYVKGNGCTEEELLKCETKLNVISAPADLQLVSDKTQLYVQCPSLLNGLSCVESFTKRCMDPMKRKQFTVLFSGTTRFIQDLCTPGLYQEEFLRHAPCLYKIKAEDDIARCARVHEITLNEIKTRNINVTFPLPVEEADFQSKAICCSFQNYIECYNHIITKNCGKGTGDFTQNILARLANPFNNIHCRDYLASCDSTNTSNTSSVNKIQELILVVPLFLIYIFSR